MGAGAHQRHRDRRLRSHGSTYEVQVPSQGVLGRFDFIQEEVDAPLTSTWMNPCSQRRATRRTYQPMDLNRYRHIPQALPQLAPPCEMQPPPDPLHEGITAKNVAGDRTLRLDSAVWRNARTTLGVLSRP